MTYTNRGVYIDLPEESDEKRIIDELRIVILFDGTHNNMINIKNSDKAPTVYPILKKVRGNDSYKKTFSNIARLYESRLNGVDNLSFIYVGGVETSDKLGGVETANELGERDTSGATGMGKYGINAKIEYGCQHIQANVNDIFDNTDVTMIKKLKIDVFGFSRGAATARSFVSRLEDVREGSETENRQVCLRKNFLPNKEGERAVEKIIPSFVGLFDTVSSFGPIFGGSFDDDVEELELQIPANVEDVVQLSAADEYRNYFSLTTIKSYGSKGKELILPGCHTDIGGGHSKKVEKERAVLRYMIPSVSPLIPPIPPLYGGCKSKDDLISEGWFPSFGILENPQRLIDEAYSFIPLHLMAKYANENSPIYNDKSIKKYVIPDDLKVANERIERIKDDAMYSFKRPGFNFIGTEADQEMLRALRGKYLHLSATGGLAHQPADKNQRKIIEG